MQNGEPLRTIVVERLELPVGQPEGQPEPSPLEAKPEPATEPLTK
jgi:hypothetical protein